MTHLKHTFRVVFTCTWASSLLKKVETRVCLFYTRCTPATPFVAVIMQPRPPPAPQGPRHVCNLRFQGWFLDNGYCFCVRRGAVNSDAWLTKGWEPETGGEIASDKQPFLFLDQHTHTLPLKCLATSRRIRYNCANPKKREPRINSYYDVISQTAMAK